MAKVSTLNKGGLTKLKKRLGLDSESALNLALNRGLFELGHISEETFWLIDEHLRRPANSNKPAE